MNNIFTIGYSSYEIDAFIKVLKINNIMAIADVRSAPYSKYKSDFNSDYLKAKLNDTNIDYVFLGDQCGARSKDINCYIDGRADYELIKNTSLFQEGLNRILKGLLKYNIALMCAELDPMICHRNILICRNLKPLNVKITHILNNGILEENSATELRLLKKFKLDNDDLFLSKEERLEMAYSKQGLEIAYQLKETEDTNYD